MYQALALPQTSITSIHPPFQNPGCNDSMSRLLPAFSHSPISSLDGLVVEQTYLLNDLNRKTTEAQNLLRRIQQQVSLNGTLHSTRKIRKLEYHLHTFLSQQNAILIHLRQLAHRIHCVQGLEQKISQFEQGSFDSSQLLYQELQYMTLEQSELLHLEIKQESQAPQERLLTSYEQCRPAAQKVVFHTPSFQSACEGDAFPLPASILDDKGSRSVSPTDTSYLPDAAPSIEAGSIRRPKLAHKSSSMNSADHIDILSTHSQLTFSEAASRKRSIPTIPGGSNSWSLTKEEIDADRN